MERTLKHELWILKNKLPKAFEYLDETTGICPPREATEDEMEAICFGGCHLCWEDYFDGDDAA